VLHERLEDSPDTLRLKTGEMRSKMTKLQDVVTVFAKLRKLCGISSTMQPTFARNGKLRMKSVGKVRVRVAETQGKFPEAHEKVQDAHLLVTVAMSDMAEVQEGSL